MQKAIYNVATGDLIVEPFSAEEEEWALAQAAAALVPVIPQKATRRQAKQALLLTKDALDATLLSKVQPAIDAIADPTQKAMMQIEWDESQEFHRNRPSLISLGTAIGLDSAAIDALFVLAATL